MTRSTDTGDDRPSEPSQRDRAAGRALARSTARLAAVQALYQMEITGQTWRAARDEFETHRIGAEIEGDQYREADLPLFRRILEGVVSRQREIDQTTDRALVSRWPLGRVDPTLRAIFRCGGFELSGAPDTPARVVISEYVDVAKAFYADGPESKFVNAVLDHMARATRGDELSPRTGEVDGPPPDGRDA